MNKPIENKIDFVLLISATNCNPNGDPLNGNRPRTNYDGMGEISDVCIKRKIRNRMQDLGNDIFVQSTDRCADGCDSLSTRAKKNISSKDTKPYAEQACEKWLDVRAFGQVFAFKGGDDSNVSKSVRGPVSIHQAISISPIDINDMQITKSVNGEPGDKKSSDTMGTKHMVNFGLYKVCGSINVQLAALTGFKDRDADILKECLRTLFENDSSSARPDGSMEVVKLYWFKHNCKEGQYSAAKVHRSVDVKLRDGVDYSSKVEDYEIKLTELDGLKPEIIDGI